MTFAEIEALGSAAERIAAYQQYVEQHPNHPLGWFNLAVEYEASRLYDDARTAAATVRRLDAALFELLPTRLRELLGADQGPDGTAAREPGGYRITRVAAASESQILYDAVRVADGTPVTLRRILDLSHAGAKTTFQLALAAPRADGVARPIEVIDDPERGPLLVVERLRGEPLRGDPRALLDAEVALRLIRAGAESVRALHRGGALHGDLRPESVVRDQTRSGDIVLVGGRVTGAAAPTPRGRLAWQSPEEAAGDVATAATDVYGLGVLLQHVLTGAEPASLGERAPIRASSDWPELDELIAQATARDPAARPGVDELIRRIDALLARREVPAVIGKWKVGRLLGEGSFGRVFAAENVDIPDHRAAIKVLHPFMARDRDMRRRFLNEASAASRIDHPGVVRILDGGVLDDGTCYIAMELLQGTDLGERLTRGPLAADLAVRLVRDGASALASAHAAKIVHRDIKPSNLFVAARPDGEQLRIVDFGTALLRGEPTREGVPYTATGHVWGTPEYMAPEQWQMLRDLDGRVDIYSLGLVLWECLAGRRPFDASTTFEWQQAHLSTPLPPLRDLAPAVPPRLVALIERMTAKRREDRIATMEEVVAELDAIRKMPETRLIEPTPTPTPTPTPPAATSRKRPLIVAGVVGLVAVGGLAAWRLWPSDPRPTVADAGAPPPDAAVNVGGGACDPPRGVTSGNRPDPDVIYSVPVDGFPSRGPANALVTIVEATDLWGRHWYEPHEQIEKFLERFPTVRFVYKPGPGGSEHLAGPTRLAACAMHRQDLFWPFYDKLVALHRARGNPGHGGHEADAVLPPDAAALPAALAALAETLGANPIRYAADLIDPACASWNGKLQVRRIGVTGAPSYLVNGRYFPGLSSTRLEELYRVELRRARACMETPGAPADYYAHLVANGQPSLR